MLLPAGIIAILILLAIGINSLQMLPGRPFYLGDPGPMSVGGSALADNPNNISLLIVRVILLAAAIGLPITLVMAMMTPDGRRQLFAYLIMGGLLVLAFMLLQGSAQPPRNQDAAKQILSKDTPPAPATSPPTDVFSPSAPDWLVLAISIGVGVLVCGIIAAVIYLVWRRSQPESTALEELSAEAQNAMASLQAGADLKDVVLRCYREMSRVLQKERGIQRQAAMTAREFETALRDKGIPAESVQQLTRLFEQVRYGRESPGPREEQLALTSLNAIIVLVGAVVLSLFVRDFVRQVIVVPVTYIAWLIDLVIRSIPQSAFWAVAVAVGILTAWGTLAAGRAALILRRSATVPILTEQSDRSVFSTRLDYIARMHNSSFAREKLAFELRVLIVKLLAYRERLPETEIERKIRAGEITTPPEVHALLTHWNTWLNWPRTPLPWLRLNRVWGRLRRMPQPDAAMERQLASVVGYIESAFGMETLMNGAAPEEQHD